MVDACGTEQLNEFVIINSGSGFNTNDIELSYDFNNNILTQQNNDININLNNFSSNPTPCGLTNGNTSAFTGCTNLISIGPGFNVPANSIVILQTSFNSQPAIYNFASLCGSGQCVYVISSSCERTAGGFTNNGGGVRTTIFQIAGSCNQTITYTVPGSSSNGMYYNTLTNTFANAGCVVPPSSPAPNPTNPIFTIDNQYCVGETPDLLPVNSNNSISGTWSPPVINTSSPGTQNYIFTPTSGQCASQYTLIVNVTANSTPTFTIDNQYCEGESPDILVTTSNNGIAGTWTPSTINTSSPGTQTYTFNPAANVCANPYVLTVTVTPNITPTFNIDDQYCEGEIPDALTTISNNGVTGTWSPSVINTSSPGTQNYTFTPTSGLCAIPYILTVTVTAKATPIFNIDNQYCVGETPDVLVSTSVNGFTGSWSPAVINTSAPGTQTYLFTPAFGQCANPYTLSVTVNANTAPIFSIDNQYCVGETPNVLITTSNNGILGTWNPTTINTSTAGTQTYIFTPAAGLCATPYTLTVTVTANAAPTFTIDNQYCIGELPDPLVTTSNNGITGTWSPGTINTLTPGTQNYNFTPTAGLCATPFILTVTVLPNQNATFTFADYCAGAANGPTGIITPGGMFTFNPFPGGGVSINPSTGVITGGVAGSTYTVQYTTPGPCPDVYTENVSVLPNVTPTLSPQGPYCTNQGPTALPTTQSGITGGWTGPGVTGNQINPSSLAPGFYTLTFNPNAGQCAASNTLQIEVIQSPTGNLTGSPVICPGQCGSVGFQFSGGTTFNITLNFTAGIFNQTFTIPAATSSTLLNFCYTTGVPFDPATNTVNIPSLVPPGTYTLTLLSVAASGGGPCAAGSVGSPGTTSVTLASNPAAQSASLSLCDLDQNGQENFNLTSLNSTVNGGIAANTVAWFSNMGATIPIGNPSNFTSGNATVYAQVTNPAGCKAVAPVTLALTQPVVLNPGSFTACVNGSPFSLPPNVGGFAGIWSGANVTGGGTMFDPAGLTAGSYPITFSPSGTVCALPATANVVIVNGGPVPLTNPIETSCPGEGSVTLSNVQGGINGTWSGSTFLTGNVFNVSASGPGTFTLTFTPSMSAGCLVANTADIVVNPNVTLNPVTFQSVCQSGSPVNLGGTVQGYTGTWSGNPQVTANVFDPNTSPGNYPLIFTPDDPCAAGFNTSITVSAPADLPPPVLGPTCIGGASITLPATVAGISGSWSYNLAPISVFAPATFGPGMFQLWFTPAAGSCANVLSVTISVSPFTAGTNSSSDLCKLGAPVVNLNTYLSAGSTPGGIWYQGSNPVANPAMFDLSALPGGANSFNYILNDPACGKDTATITFNISPANNAGNNGQATLCENNATSVNFSSLLGPHDAGGSWTQPSGAGIDLSNLTSVNLSSLQPGNFTFSYVISADLCPADTALVSVTIRQYNSAGNDVQASVCLGAVTDLKDILNTTYLGGTFLNPDNVPGLTGSILSTSGLTAGQYKFKYVAVNQAPCLADTANITLTLAANVTAGVDISDFYCQGQDIVLNDLLSPQASGGGKFYVNNVLVANGIITNPGPGNISVTYVVGDGISCPKDTSYITLGPVSKPVISLPQIADICENDCQLITVTHTVPNGGNIYVSVRAGSGAVYRMTEISTGAGQFTLNICAAATGPFSVTKIPVGQNFTFTVDSIRLSEGSCVFGYSQSITFSTKKLPERTLNASLCKGETLIVGQDVYSETKTSGTTVIASANPALCDSLIRVNVIFLNPSPETKIERTTCDQNFSVTVGSQVFNRLNPSGSVLLKNKGGCDSLVTVDLSFKNFSTGTFFRSTCDQNAKFTVGNQSFDINKQQGMVTLTGASVFGCDSVVDVKITFLPPSVRTISQMTCDDNFTLTVGGKLFNKQTPSGQVVLTGGASNGCDSTINVTIDFLPRATGTESITTCDPNFSVTIGGITINKANPVGTVNLPGAAANGCDSIVNVRLTIILFEVSNTLDYNCDGTNPLFTLNLASLPGPYEVRIDGNIAAQNQNLPYSSALAPGTHNVIVISPEGCKDTLAVKVDDTNEPAVDLTQAQNPDGSVQLNIVAPPNVLYNLVWTPSATLSCSDCLNPVANPAETTTYTVQYSYSQDCEGSRTITVEKKNTVITVPNVFSPDGSGSNDVFYINLPDDVTATVKKMAIYDRWGNIIFLTENVPAGSPSVGWNGTFHGREVQPGVYVYLVILQIDGKATEDTLKGDITIVR